MNEKIKIYFRYLFERIRIITGQTGEMIIYRYMNRQREGGWQNNFEIQRMFPKAIYMHSTFTTNRIKIPTLYCEKIYIQHIKYKNIMQTFC